MNVQYALKKMSIVDNSAIQTDRCIPKRHFIDYGLCIFTAFCPLELFSLRGMFKDFCDQCISIRPYLSSSSFHVVWRIYIHNYDSSVENSDFSPLRLSSSLLLIFFFSLNFTFLDFRLRIPTATLFPGTFWTIPKWQAPMNLPVHRLKSFI